MAANPRLVNTDVTFTYDGVTQRVQRGQIIDVPSGSALETAIGLSNLTALSGQDSQIAEVDTGDVSTEDIEPVDDEGGPG